MQNERNFFKIAYWGSISSLIVWLIFVICFQPYNLPTKPDPVDVAIKELKEMRPPEYTETSNEVYNNVFYNTIISTRDILTEDQIIAKVKRAIKDKCPILVYIDTVERVESGYGTEFYIDDYGSPLQIVYHEATIGAIVSAVDISDSMLDKIVKEWEEGKE